jgi:hypothetical protein
MVRVRAYVSDVIDRRFEKWEMAIDLRIGRLFENLKKRHRSEVQMSVTSIWVLHIYILTFFLIIYQLWFAKFLKMFSAYPKPFIIIFGQTSAKVIYPAIVWFWVLIRDRPFNLEGGLWFFCKKIFWFPMLLKKIFWFWWILLNSGKKFRASRCKKYKCSNSGVVRQKNCERNKKP